MKKTQIVSCQPRDGGVELKQRGPDRTPGSLSQPGSAHTAENYVQMPKCRLYDKSFWRSGQRNVAAENLPLVGTGLSYKPGLGCSIELDLWHRASLLPQNLPKEEGQNRPSRALQSSILKTRNEGPLLPDAPTWGTSPSGVHTHWTGQTDTTSWYEVLYLDVCSDEF